MTNIVFKNESYRIVGACMEIYNEMGCGFLESVYQECLEYEMADRSICAVPQQHLKLRFKQRTLKSVFIPDFVCFGKIVVELKCTSDLCDKYRAQVINYLRATNLKLGILVNFGQHDKLQYERIVFG